MCGRGLRGLTIIALLLLSGCGLQEEIRQQVDTVLGEAAPALDAARAPGKSRFNGTVRVHQGVWLGRAATAYGESDPLPARLDGADAVTLSSRAPLTLEALASRLSTISGVPVRLADDLVDPGPEQEGERPDEAGRTMTLAYTGPFSGLLDLVAGHFGVWWRHVDGRIEVFRHRTRTWTVHALPNVTEVDADLSSGLTGGGATAAAGAAPGQSQSTSHQNVRSTAALQVWADVEAALKGMVGEAGTLSVSPATGTVTVTATPRILERVDGYVSRLNRSLGRQVAIGVRVLSVTLSDSDRYGLDLDAVFTRLSAGVTYAVRGPVTALPSDVGRVSVGILNAKEGGGLARWDGSGAVIEALSDQGRVSVVTSTAVTTMNNRVAPVQVATQRSFIRSIETTTTEIGTNTSVEPGTLVTGFNMHLMPRILEHGRLLLQFAIQLSELEEMNSVVVDGTTIQLPEVSTRSFLEEVVMRSGSTLVLAGFERVNAGADAAGMGHPLNPLLGGEWSATKQRTVLVVLLTPEVLVSDLTPEARIGPATGRAREVSE